MELQPHAGGAGSDIELQLQPAVVKISDNGESKDSHTVCDESHPTIDHVVVNVDHLAEAIDVESSSSHQVAGAEDDDDENCCLVCTDPMEWVAVGRCGHRVVCRKCAVRLRFFYRNKRCCICRAYCFRVLVTKAAAAAADAASSSTTSLIPPLLWFAFWEGHVTGKYWYHRHSEAFFEDEEEYKAAKKACQGILAPFYRPLIIFIPCMLFCVNMGAVYGWTVAIDEAARVRTRVLSISIALLVFTFWWTVFKCARDPLHIETYRLARQLRQRQQL